MIFGQQSPKIVDGSSNHILLDYSVILKDEPEFRNLQQESPINGNRSFHHRGYHWIYEIRYHLFKEANPRTKFETLHALLGDTDLTLYRHRDTDPIQDSSGVDVAFFFAEIIPIYIETANYTDGLILKFKSLKFVDLTKSLDATLVTESTGETITAEDGESIIIG